MQDGEFVGGVGSNSRGEEETLGACTSRTVIDALLAAGWRAVRVTGQQGSGVLLTYVPPGKTVCVQCGEWLRASHADQPLCKECRVGYRRQSQARKRSR
jgi:hypothetical protein